MKNGKRPGGGSRKGVPNKATADVRAALALMLEGNVGKVEAWVREVAEGVKEPRTEGGKPVLGDDGQPLMKWLRAPDPGYATRLLLDVAEYHIPRLARTEINDEIGIRGKLIIGD